MLRTKNFSFWRKERKTTPYPHWERRVGCRQGQGQGQGQGQVILPEKAMTAWKKFRLDWVPQQPPGTCRISIAAFYNSGTREKIQTEKTRMSVSESIKFLQALPPLHQSEQRTEKTRMSISEPIKFLQALPPLPHVITIDILSQWVQYCNSVRCWLVFGNTGCT